MGSGDHRLMSKTQHYRKVTKPLLERKRRARMNFYLDALKDLIVDTMEAQGDHVTKLEKADILEMTVQYLKTKKNIINSQLETPLLDPKKFEAGYSQAAYEVSKVFASFPGLDLRFGTKLMKHLGYQLKDINTNPNMLLYHSKCHLEFEDLQEENDKPKEREVWRPW